MRDEHQNRLGAHIARLREQQGWSQRALAKWVGIDQSAVSRIEAGRRRLSADELQRFAEALHVSADDLLSGAPGASAPAFARSQAPGPVPASGATRPSASLTPDDAGRADRLTFTEDPVARDLVEPRPSDVADGASAPPSGSTGQASQDGSYRRSMAPSPAPLSALRLSDVDVISHGPVPHGDMATSGRPAQAPYRGLPRLAGLPDAVACVARDWFVLRRLAEAPEPAQRWSAGHSAEGKPERVLHTPSALRSGATAGDVLFDRVARFWRSELHVDPDDGPMPDLVPLLEDGYGAQVIVARVAPLDPGAPRDLASGSSAADLPAGVHPVAAAFTVEDTPFIFVNAARPVVLQRFALAHAFAHLVLGHGDVIDSRVEWSRNVPPEAAANDFAEELLAPVRAVQRWYERRPERRSVGMDDLLELGNAFGVSAWSALYRSRAADRLQGKQFHVLKGELHRHEWEILPRQAYLGGLRDTLTFLTPREVLPPDGYGGPAVLRVPATMRSWTLTGLRNGRLSLEDAAAMLRLDAGGLAEQLERLGFE